VTFKAIDDPSSIRVYEQNYEANLISQSAILKKYIEKKVELVAEFGREVKQISGILLAHGDKFIVKTNTGIVILNKIVSV
jgi:hypothetical protein